MDAHFKRSVEISQFINGRELGEMFWGMDAEQQTHFLNVLGEKTMLPSQLQSITDWQGLNSDGRRAMRYIGEYAKKKE